LRYFNIFGRRQDPNGVYAAVIPKWISSMIGNEPIFINGDGQTSRDFCYVENAIQANFLAAVSSEAAAGQIYNVAVGDRTTLNELYEFLKESLSKGYPHISNMLPTYRDFRQGDVRHSLADISKAGRLLGYQPAYRVRDGLQEAMPWFTKYFEQEKTNASNYSR
jgi:UDP-N-acetylglucosamine 4-epimerase